MFSSYPWNTLHGENVTGMDLEEACQQQHCCPTVAGYRPEKIALEWHFCPNM